MPRKRRSRKKKTPDPHWQVVEDALDEQWRSRAPARRQRRRAGALEEARPTVPTVYVMGALARQTAKLLGLAAPGRSSPEVVYWIGLDLDDLACVTTLVVPSADMPEDAVVATTLARDETFASLAGAPLVLLAAVRSHAPEDPRRAPFAGREGGDGFEGVLVVEIPPLDDGRFDLAACVVHRQMGGERRQVPSEELPRHLRIVPGYRDLRKKSRQTASRR